MWSSVQEPSSIEPYTSSVETCTTRRTECRSDASNTCWAPSTLVSTNPAAPVMERSTWDSAAKFTTTSCPGRAASRSAGTQMSPCTKRDRKSTRLNSSHANISYAVFCLKKKTDDAINELALGIAQD